MATWYFNKLTLTLLPRDPSLMRPHRRLWLWLREPAAQSDSTGGPNLPAGDYSTQPLPSNGTPRREEGPIAIVIAPCPLTELSMWFGSKRGAMGGTASNLLFFNSHLPPASGCLISVFIFRCYRLELQLKLVSPFAPPSSLKGCFSA